LISDWWTYSLADFLLFSPRAYYALIERYNHDVWPLHVASVAVGVALAIAFVRPNRVLMRLGTAFLGVAWLWIAWAFIWERYVTINWAATWLAAAFAMQGLLLLIYAATGFGTQTQERQPIANVAGAGLFFVFALAVYPLVGPVMGRGWPAAEIFGLAADPTAVATLAWLAPVPGGARKWWMLVIPALWCAVTGATLWALGAPDFFLAPVCALVVIAVAVMPAR
jgi:hypothetical protein